MLRERLISLPAGVFHAVIGMLPHVLPIGSGILYIPGDEGLPLPRDRKPDAGVRVQGIPQDVRDES